MGAFDAVDGRYAALYARAEEVLGADDRVVAVEAAGSIGAGAADEWSDLDVHVAVFPESYDSFVADWPRWLSAITPTVFARTPIAPFIINAVTAEGLTLDVVVYRGELPAPPRPAGYAVGMLSAQRYATLTDALEYAVEEKLRGLAGPFITLIGRDDHITHLTGVAHIVRLLTTVLLAENGSAPAGKILRESLTDEQQSVVAGLPALHASREALIEFDLALTREMLTRARPLYARYGLTWPAPLAAVAATRLRDKLGINAADWLY